MSYKNGICGIYKLYNLVSNKCYIGYSYNCEDRKNHHFKRLRKNIHNSPHLQSAWNKYGEKNFIFEILESCKREDLARREHFWINYFKSYDKEFGYNIVRTSEDGKSRIVSPETKLKISSKLKGKPSGRMGEKMKDEIKEKIKNALIGKKHTQESKNKMKLSWEKKRLNKIEV